MKRALVVFIVALAIAAGAALYLRQKYQAEHDETITIYGNVDIRQVPLSFRVPGRIASMGPEEGASVTAGQIIAMLDAAPYKADMAAAEGNLAEAKARLEALINGLRPQEIEQARAQLTESKAALASAQKEYERNKPLLAQQVIANQEFDNIRSLRDEAAARVDAAQQALSMAIEGSRNEDIKAGQAAVQTAAAQLEAARLNLRDATLAAPADGIIFTKIMEPGAVVAAGQSVYLLSLSGPARIRSYLEERHLGAVHVGMDALVSTEANPDSPIKGTVTFISPEAEFTPKTVQTTTQRPGLVYMIRVETVQPTNLLRQGQPVAITLLAAKKDSAPTRLQVIPDGQPRPARPESPKHAQAIR